MHVNSNCVKIETFCEPNILAVVVSGTSVFKIHFLKLKLGLEFRIAWILGFDRFDGTFVVKSDYRSLMFLKSGISLFSFFFIFSFLYDIHAELLASSFALLFIACHFFLKHEVEDGPVGESWFFWHIFARKFIINYNKFKDRY